MINAEHYGQALYALAAQEKNDDALLAQLAVVHRLLDENPDYRTLLDTPALTAAVKQELLSQAFADFAPLLRDFLGLLCKKRCLFQLGDCEKAFSRCYDEAHDILRASVRTAVPLLPRQTERLTQRLGALTGKKVVLTAAVEPSLLGGVVLRYDGVSLNDSIRGRLEALRRTLRDTIV